MAFGSFEEKKSQADVVNEKLDKFTTLLWKYKTGSKFSFGNKESLFWMIFFGATIGLFLGGFLVGILSYILGLGEIPKTILIVLSVILGAYWGGFYHFIPGYGILSVSLSSDGNYVAAGSKDGNVYFFDREGKLLWKHGGHLASLSSDGSYIAIESENKVNLFDRNGNLLWNFGHYLGEYALIGGEIWSGLSSVAFEGNHIVAAFHYFDDMNIIIKIFLLDLQGNRLWEYDPHGAKPFFHVSISSDGAFVTAVRKNEVHFLNKEGKLLWEYKKDKICRGSISPDGSYIFIVNYSNDIQLLDKEGKLLWSYRTDGRIGCYDISSDGSYIAAGSDDNKIYFFSKNGNLLWISETNGMIQSVAITQDGSFITAGSKDNNIYFLNRDGELLWKYKTGGEVHGIAISSDGSYIAGGSQDREIYFFKFDIERAGELKT